MTTSPDIKLDTETSLDLDFPSLWGVRFLNDDFTPMDFVILVLMQYFGLSAEDAQATTIKVHKEGQAIVGSYPKDIAETKAVRAEAVARGYGHPLRMEAVEL